MEDKYGHVYPEAAVAPLYDLVEGLLLKIVGSQTAQRIEVEASDLRAALNAHDAASFPTKEPLFLLRGQDELAPDTVRYYAYDWHRRLDQKNAEEVANRIVEWADRMEAWQPRKLPD